MKKNKFIICIVLIMSFLINFPLEIYANEVNDEVPYEYQTVLGTELPVYRNDKELIGEASSDKELVELFKKANSESIGVLKVIVKNNYVLSEEKFEDLIRLSYVSYSDRINIWLIDEYPHYTFKFGYLTTLAEKEIVNEFVKQWVKNNINESMSDYEKSYKIYKFVAEKHWYFYTDLENTSNAYKKRTSVYGIITHKKGICGAYSGLYELLSKESGLDVISVVGTADDAKHAWNMINLNGNWYHIDVTYGSCHKFSFLQDKYFLFSDDEVKNREWDNSIYPNATVKWVNPTENK